MSRKVTPFEFGTRTGKGGPMDPDIAQLYYGHDCGCGQKHVLDSNVETPRDLPTRREFVAVCPSNPAMMNLLKIRGLFRIRGVESLVYSEIASDEDQEKFVMGMGRGKGLV